MVSFMPILWRKHLARTLGWESQTIIPFLALFGEGPHHSLHANLYGSHST